MKPIVVEVGPVTCETPKELLESRPFAEFLSLFNRHRRKLENALNVLPEEVAQDASLAQRVDVFYNGNKSALSLGEGDRGELDALIGDTLASVRSGLARIFEEGERRPLPEWVAEFCPNAPLLVSAESAQQMERIFQQWWPFCRQHMESTEIHWALVTRMMNNFFTHFVHRPQKLRMFPGRLREKMGHNADRAGYGTKIRNLTWGEFYAEIDSVLGEKGLSRKDIGESDCDQASLTLLPVFLELLQRGYKVYPDLSL
jgi:hypothetical protein